MPLKTRKPPAQTTSLRRFPCNLSSHPTSLQPTPKTNNLLNTQAIHSVQSSALHLIHLDKLSWIAECVGENEAFPLNSFDNKGFSKLENLQIDQH